MTSTKLVVSPKPAGGREGRSADPVLPGRSNMVERIMLELQVDEHRCLSCGGCVSVCPRMDIPVSAFESIAAGVLCRGCGICVRACPVEALRQVPVALNAPLARPVVGERRHDRPIIRAYPTGEPA